MWKDFIEFIKRGNVVDMAVGIIIGAAFTTVVQSLVNDIIMPPIGLVTGGADFADLFITLGGGRYESLLEAEAAGAATIKYGFFVNNVITFLIVAFAVFLLILSYRRLSEKEEVKEAVAEEITTKTCPECLSDIPLEARRCAYCTVVVDPIPSPPAELP